MLAWLGSARAARANGNHIAQYGVAPEHGPLGSMTRVTRPRPCGLRVEGETAGGGMARRLTRTSEMYAATACIL